jgi:LPS-assembly protein
MGAAFFAVGILPAQEANGEKMPIEITAEGENSYEGGIAHASGNVVVKYGSDIVYADRIMYDAKKREVMATGNVRVYAGDRIYRGDRLNYNFDTRAVQSLDFRTADYPMFGGGVNATTPDPNHYSIKDGFFTTDNRANPSFRFKASTVEIYPDDEVVLKNVVLYIGPVPVAWIPFYVQSLKDDRANFNIELGGNSRYGLFALSTYSWYQSPALRGAVRFDVRSERGFAGGLDLEYKPTKLSEGLFRGYYAQDNDPDQNETSLPRSETSASRYWLSLQQRVPFADGISTSADLNIESDPHIREDFFEGEFRGDRQPDNYFDIVQHNPNFTISALTRLQINDFYNTLERKPEVSLDIKRVKLFGSPIAYEGSATLTNFGQSFAEGSGMQDYTAYRYDTFHQVLYPRQYFNWLNLTPRMGLRGTYYDYNPSDANNSFSTPLKDDLGRYVFDVGFEAGFKVSRAWLDVKNKSLGLDGMRHVMEPMVNVQYVPEPNERPSDFLGFDTRLGSTRLAPLNFPSYNTIDSIDQQLTVRPGFRNKLQTKRDGRNWNLLDWVVYADLDLDGNQIAGHHFSNIYSDLRFKPVPWLTFVSFSSKDITGDGFDESNNGFLWQANKALEFGAGNRYLQDSVLFPDSNLIYVTSFYRLNEHWQFSTQHSFETDDGELEEQSYTIYRDLSAWQVALSLKDRNNRGGEHEQLVYLSFTLKAFPNQQLSVNAE